MSSLFFWFVYLTLDDVYKVKAVFITLSQGVNSLFFDLGKGGLYLTKDKDKGSK